MGGKGRVATIAVLATLAAPALAINKCVGADGRISYTDGDCAAEARTIRIEAAPQPDAAAQAEAQARGEQLKSEARALDARQAAETRARQAREEAARQAEARLPVPDTTPVEIYVRPIVRHVHPVPPRPIVPRPPQPPRPPAMGNYPFKRE